jgi:hypothetical protein
MLKALRDHLGLLSLVVVLVGVSSTEAYYGSYGLRYQFLSIPTNHVLYRGLTATFDSMLIAGLYLVAIAAMAGQSRLAFALGGLDRVRWLNYALVVLVAVAAWFAGLAAGYSAAITDSTEGVTGLPLIQALHVKNGSAVAGIDSAVQGYHLLLHTSSGAYILRPVRDPETETPTVQFVAGGTIESLRLCARC